MEEMDGAYGKVDGVIRRLIKKDLTEEEDKEDT